jgi:hypothetical protein
MNLRREIALPVFRLLGSGVMTVLPSER